ncbi:MAG: hypothetical protein V3U80_02535 [Flavobacteriaceae bacterium]
MSKQEQYINYKSNLEHSDYHDLMNIHFNTEVFADVIDFIDLAFPKWRTHEGLGIFAPEFLKEIIESFQYSTDENETSKEKLEHLYSEITYSYIDKEYWNKDWTFKLINKKIELDHDEELYDLERDGNIPSVDYVAFIKILQEKYMEEYHPIIPYNFDEYEYPNEGDFI